MNLKVNKDVLTLLIAQGCLLSTSTATVETILHNRDVNNKGEKEEKHAEAAAATSQSKGLRPKLQHGSTGSSRVNKKPLPLVRDEGLRHKQATKIQVTATDLGRLSFKDSSGFATDAFKQPRRLKSASAKSAKSGSAKSAKSAKASSAEFVVQCFTGTSAEVTQQCADEGAECCQTPQGEILYPACDWPDIIVGEVCSRSCNGVGACFFYQDGAVTQFEAGAYSCNGRFACLAFLGGTIGTGSCNSLYSCNVQRQPVGDRSCNGDNVCTDGFASVGDDSCDGFDACAFNTATTIGDDACTARNSCKYANITNIGDGECISENECLSVYINRTLLL